MNRLRDWQGVEFTPNEQPGARLTTVKNGCDSMASQSSDHPVRFKIFEIAVDYPGGIFLCAGLFSCGVKPVPQVLQFFHQMSE
jgi:hypothetical protein